jgi:hypothetical protein
MNGMKEYVAKQAVVISQAQTIPAITKQTVVNWLALIGFAM